jgi:hypothetical protein
MTGMSAALAQFPVFLKRPAVEAGLAIPRRD